MLVGHRLAVEEVERAVLRVDALYAGVERDGAVELGRDRLRHGLDAALRGIDEGGVVADTLADAADGAVDDLVAGHGSGRLNRPASA